MHMIKKKKMEKGANEKENISGINTCAISGSTCCYMNDNFRQLNHSPKWIPLLYWLQHVAFVTFD